MKVNLFRSVLVDGSAVILADLLYRWEKGSKNIVTDIGSMRGSKEMILPFRSGLWLARDSPWKDELDLVLK